MKEYNNYQMLHEVLAVNELANPISLGILSLAALFGLSNVLKYKIQKEKNSHQRIKLQRKLITVRKRIVLLKSQKKKQ